jgi:hypothetical protein
LAFSDRFDKIIQPGVELDRSDRRAGSNRARDVEMETWLRDVTIVTLILATVIRS